MPVYSNGERTASQHLSRNLQEAFDNENIERIRVCPVPSNISEKEKKEWLKNNPQASSNGLLKTYYFSMFLEKKSSVQRAIRYMLIHFKQYFCCLKHKDIDVIRVSSTPPTQGLVAVLIKKRLKAPLVYVLQDIFPDSLVTAKMTHKGSLIWKIGRMIENFTYRHSDKIIVISEDFKQNIMAKGVPEEKIVIIPNWTDEDAVVDIKRNDNKIFDKYNLDRNKFYFCYSGNIGLSQNMDLLLNTAIKAEKLNSDIRFVIIGDGADRERVVKRIEQEKITNVITLPFQPYEEVSSVFSLGDVDLIISKPGVGNSSVPSKTWDCMSAKRPILASFDINSKFAEIINENNCGICCPADDEEAFLEAVLKMASNKEDLLEYAENGKKYLSENLSKEKCIKKHIDVLKSFEKQP